MNFCSVWDGFWSDESGQGLVEYSLIIALMSIGLVLLLGELRDTLGGVFDDATAAMDGAEANQYLPAGFGS